MPTTQEYRPLTCYTNTLNHGTHAKTANLSHNSTEFNINNNNNNNNRERLPFPTHLCLDSTFQCSRRLGYLCPHNPRGRRLAVPAFLDFSLVFNPRDLYYRGYKKNLKK